MKNWELIRNLMNVPAGWDLRVILEGKALEKVKEYNDRRPLNLNITHTGVDEVEETMFLYVQPEE